MKFPSRPCKSHVTGRGGVHGRTMNFFDAAARRLAWNDYDAVSVSMICRDARSTPYTFYRRFPNKRAFLYALVLVTFRSRTSAFIKEMSEFASKERTAVEIIDRIVDEVIAGTMTVSGMGVTHLAVRIGMSTSKGAEPYLTYRRTVTATAVDLLSPKLKGDDARGRIRSVVQMLFATATDEAWRYGIPFTTAHKRDRAKEYGLRARQCLGIAGGDSSEGQLSMAILLDQPFPEQMKTAFPLSKRALRSFAKDINRSQKPDFPLGDPIEPLDIMIAATRDENRKTQKPLRKRPPIEPSKPRRKRRIRVV